MKIAVIIVRVLMGLLFLFASVSYFLNLIPQPELSGNVKLFMEGMLATGYMMPLIKGTELMCGLAFVLGRFVPLAAVIISPVIVNIFFFHTLVDPSDFPVAAFLVLANSFLGYAYWDRFKPIMSAR